jgi:hypothetical protein
MLSQRKCRSRVAPPSAPCSLRESPLHPFARSHLARLFGFSTMSHLPRSWSLSPPSHARLSPPLHGWGGAGVSGFGKQVGHGLPDGARHGASRWHRPWPPWKWVASAGSAPPAHRRLRDLTSLLLHRRGGRIRRPLLL